VVRGAAVLAIWAFLFKSGPWIVSGDTTANLVVEHSRTLEMVNQCLYYALLAAVIFSAGQLLVDLYGLVRGHRIAPLPCLNTDGSGRLTSLTVGSLPA